MLPSKGLLGEKYCFAVIGRLRKVRPGTSHAICDRWPLISDRLEMDGEDGDRSNGHQRNLKALDKKGQKSYIKRSSPSRLGIDTWGQLEQVQVQHALVPNKANAHCRWQR